MEKKGQMKILMIFVIIIMIIGISFVVWQEKKKTSKDTDIDSEISEERLKEIEKLREANNTEPTINNTVTNESVTNETTNLSTDTIPNPTGSVTYIDRQDVEGGYFCNGSEDPEHRVRVYTYKLIEGIKELSEDYIESEKVDGICDTYNNVNDSIGMRYNLDWNSRRLSFSGRLR